jgi:hypothetical protein
VFGTPRPKASAIRSCARIARHPTTVQKMPVPIPKSNANVAMSEVFIIVYVRVVLQQPTMPVNATTAAPANDFLMRPVRIDGVIVRRLDVLRELPSCDAM